MSNERTTKELIEILGRDYEYFHERIITCLDNGEQDEQGNTYADISFESRQLVRTLFAYIEAVTFSVKVTSIEKCIRNNIPISDAERYFSVEIKHDIKDNGEIFERSAQIRLIPNLRLSFNLLAKSQGVEKAFDTSEEWWSCLKDAIKIRDRLMHPKFPEDLDIEVSELIKVMKAKNGFDKFLLNT